MKRTRFMKKCMSDKNELILLNTYNGTMVVVNPGQVHDYEYVLNNPNCSDYSEISEYLIKRQFLIDDFVDEDARAELHYFEGAHSTRTLLLTILPTEDCNFRCQYCYEEHNKGKMAKETSSGIKNFLKKNLHKYDMLQVNWFGGEPLEAIDVIADLSDFFIAICREQKKPYRASMTTNGYSLDIETFTKLYRWHIIDYQITLDGDENAHNMTRPYKNGEGTYIVILNNLRNIRDHIKTQNISVTIRTNITKSVLNNIDNHIIFISNEFGKDKRFGVIFKIAWSNEKDTDFNHKELIETGKLHSILNSYMDKGLRFKINREQICSIAGICYAAHSNAFVIGADGIIYKCTVEYKKEINQIGILTEDGVMHLNKDRLAFWITKPVFKGEYEKCHKCFFMPACMGVYCPINRFDKLGRHQCAGMKDYVDEYMKLCAQANDMVEWR